MSLFRRPDYHSEVSLFIDQFKANRPALEAQQRAGRALLWDLSLDRSAKVAQKPYVYQTKSDQ